VTENNDTYLPGEAFIEIGDYDDGIRQLVPYYDLMHEVTANILPPETSSILELGSGTGELTLKLLSECKQARFLCIDYSERMIPFMKNKLRQRGFHSRVEWITANIENIQLLEHDFLQKNSVDACVSSLVLHHLDDDKKQQLVHHIFHLLKPGGHFWIADAVLPESNEMAFHYNLAREKWLAKNLLTRQMLSPKMLQDKFYSSADNHNPTTLENSVKMLKNAGFRSTEILWKYFGMAVFGGIKQ
jgi:trans-aconitate 2-methyltransferase